MFRTKQFMSTISLVFMLLGMMVVFQADEVEADHSSWWCKIASHRSFPSRLVYRWVSTGSWIGNTNCANCYWLAPAVFPHIMTGYEEEARSEQEYQHWVPFRWVYCHSHILSSWSPTGKTKVAKTLCNRQPIVVSK